MFNFKRRLCSIIFSVIFLHLMLVPIQFSEAFGLFQSLMDTIDGGIQSLGNVYCSGVRCCDFHLNGEFEVTKRLAILLEQKLYGQHIAKSLILEAVSSHRRHRPQKALGIGMHGWTGTGKNYVSEMIAESLYKKGLNSPLVHVFAGKASFPDVGEVNLYKKNLLGWIRGNVSQCGHSLFIFDECEKMPETLLDVLKPFLDYHPVIEGVDYRNAIFLFLTNSGGSVIGERMLELHEEGVIRENLKFEHFHNEISISLFNQEGAFFRGDIIRGDSIDFHIPFLPMEEKHIRMCVMNQFARKGYYNPSKELIQAVLENMHYGPESNPVFSMTGCKRVHSLVVNAIANLKLEL